MARVSQRVNYYNFSGGKVSDTNPLTPPENVVRTMLNVNIHRDGSVRRRFGLEPEPGFAFPYDLDHVSTDELEPTKGFLPGHPIESLGDQGWDCVTWDHVDNNPEITFVVVRNQHTLLFYEPSVDNLSNRLRFTLDISVYRTDPALPSSRDSFNATSGKGLLVCSGGYYRPFYVQYKEQEDTWVTAGIDIRVRDFEGVDDGYRLDYRLTVAENNSNGGKRLYNLYNQGWAKNEIESFVNNMDKRGGGARIPANTDIASLGRMIDSDKRVYEFARTSFQAHPIVLRPISTGRAPMGHFIIDPFDTNTRATEASRQNGGVFNVGGEIINKRPKAVAFYAGRFFYGSVNGVVYYSKIVEGVSDLGKCYQENDPTTEDINQLLDTDGGTIKIMGVGTVERLVPMGNSLVAIGTNGIYVISGGADKGFTANSQQVGFLSDTSVLGGKSIVSTEGSVLFWSDRGIFAIGLDELGAPKIQSLSNNRISKDYDKIPVTSKSQAVGVYAPDRGQVIWIYSMSPQDETEGLSKDHALVLDTTLGAFWDYEFERGVNNLYSNSPPILVSPVFVKTRGVPASSQEAVVDDLGEVVTDNNLEEVTVTVFTGSRSANEPLLFLVLIPDGSGMYRPTFSKMSSTKFKDWDRFSKEGIEEVNGNSLFTDWPEVDITSVDFTSKVETVPQTLGEPSNKKQSTYCYLYTGGRESSAGTTTGYPIYDITNEGLNPAPELPGSVIPALLGISGGGQIWGVFGGVGPYSKFRSMADYPTLGYGNPSLVVAREWQPPPPGTRPSEMSFIVMGSQGGVSFVDRWSALTPDLAMRVGARMWHPDKTPPTKGWRDSGARAWAVVSSGEATYRLSLTSGSLTQILDKPITCCTFDGDTAYLSSDLANFSGPHIWRSVGGGAATPITILGNESTTGVIAASSGADIMIRMGGAFQSAGSVGTRISDGFNYGALSATNILGGAGASVLLRIKGGEIWSHGSVGGVATARRTRPVSGTNSGWTVLGDVTLTAPIPDPHSVSFGRGMVLNYTRTMEVCSLSSLLERRAPSPVQLGALTST